MRPGRMSRRHSRFPTPAHLSSSPPLSFLLAKCPSDVLAHQWRRVLAPCIERRDDVFAVLGVAQAHREITQPTLEADAANRTAFHSYVEVRLAPRKELGQFRTIKAMADVEVGLAARLRVLVPRTGELAIVAAIDSISDQRTKAFRNASLELDR